MYAAIRESRFLISTILWNTTKISTNCPLISSEDPVAEKIGYYISTLIDDGACLQMGQGTVPNAILKFLEDKKDIGIHTEVFSDNLIPLIEKGVVNGAKKNIDTGKIVATFCAGNKGPL